MSDRDAVDQHVERWLPVVPDLDPDVEGAVVRMSLLTRHLREVKDRALAALDLQEKEYGTLHALAGRGGRAAPSEIAGDLRMAPASITARVDALIRRGFVQRIPSEVDRRRIDVELTDAGRAAWRRAMGVVGDEEQRVLGVLTAQERRVLADLLRRVTLAAGSPPGRI
ncbi:MarR family transcriptional regulator [Micromonospora terminaliae]|uniref:MarR family transcriptional regulator n=1 Tax=Micromonospora terminaliae TaxID=1914461 RepID=A0AAJ3DIS2_9ACTN|nr:MarR family transcriptional regulator [Micromonospora terminaliae]NES27691.1 MarR family transcriptional regulator [Micromonospora terminaliae]QGL47515.1 MarR family transcriptional regulator [Micromonospora terminaliae]